MSTRRAQVVVTPTYALFVVIGGARFFPFLGAFWAVEFIVNLGVARPRGHTPWSPLSSSG